MTETEAQALLDRYVPHFLKLFRLEDWSIRFAFDLNDCTMLGCCDSAVPYEDARIRFNLNLIETPKDFVSTLRHELIHLVLSDQNFLEEAVTPYIKNAQAQASFDTAATFVNERMVRNLEKIFDQLDPLEL